MVLEKHQYTNLFIYEKNKNEKRINTDEMVARVGSWEDNNLQIKKTIIISRANYQ